MPFKIKKVEEKYRIYNLEKKRFTRGSYKTRASARKVMKNYENYDKRKSRTKPNDY